MTPKEQIQFLIEELDKDPYAILCEKGIKGIRDDPWSCPVAKYLQQELDLADWAVTICGQGIVVAKREMLYFNTPLNILRFLRDFDSGRYPELDSIK